MPKIGMVFRSFSKVAQKEKFYVVAGISEDSILVGHVLINSKSYKQYAPTPEIETLHIPIYEIDYDFLHHDSYIDCRKLHDMDYIRIEDMFVKDKGKYKGMLTDEDIEALKYTIQNATTIKPKQKKKYG
ncbi:MAG: hypothetical protein FP812_19265 [Desulfobacula sp.]|nr:hypothetical protein [Desulfobacula sp.]